MAPVYHGEGRPSLVPDILTLGTSMESWVRTKGVLMDKQQELVYPAEPKRTEQFSQAQVDEIIRQYRRELSHRSREAVRQKVKSGDYAGFAPTGYRNVRVGGKATVRIDPELGPLVAEAFRLAGRKRTSLRKIIDELGPRGLVSRDGTPMSPATLCRILANPFYVGMIRYGDQIYPGSHQSLVSPSMFDRAGRRLRKRRCSPGSSSSRAVGRLSRLENLGSQSKHLA